LFIGGVVARSFARAFSLSTRNRQFLAMIPADDL
jgi:hypothetical protein